MVALRDYSAMYANHACVVCNGFCCEASAPLHTKRHLADGTAVVEKAFGKVDRVVPTSSLPVKDTADDPNPPKPKPITPMMARRMAQKMRAVRGHSYRPGP